MGYVMASLSLGRSRLVDPRRRCARRSGQSILRKCGSLRWEFCGQPCCPL